MKKPSLMDLEKRILQLEQTVALFKKPRRTRIQLELDGEEDQIDIVQKIVCEVWKISLSILLSDSRKREVTDARKAGMHLSFVHRFGSTQKIAGKFNREDHSTVVHAVKSVENLLENRDAIFCKLYDTAKKELRKHFKLETNLNYQI